MPLDWSTLTIMATVAGTSFMGAFWLNGKFEEIKHLLSEHEKRDDARFNEIGLRLLKTELLLDRDGDHIAAPMRHANQV